jgi:hypothetical protein
MFAAAQRAYSQQHARTLTQASKHTQFELDKSPVGINTSFERDERQFQLRPEISEANFVDSTSYYNSTLKFVLARPFKRKKRRQRKSAQGNWFCWDVWIDQNSSET